MGVYLPHETHKDGIEHYLETLHELQGLVDNCNDHPHIVVGDFNTRLPMAKTLNTRWYRSGCFNVRSRILHDFLTDNELYVTNFSFSQKVNYTFRNYNSKSYIDHVMAPVSMADKVIKCNILCDENNVNVSDHLPICVHVCLTIRCSKPDHNARSCSPRINWQDHNVQKSYCESLEQALSDLPLHGADNVHSKEDAVRQVNTIYTSLCDCLNQASESVKEEVSKANSGRRKHW